MDLKHMNLENLQALWRLVGTNVGDYISTNSYEMSVVANSEWPNRIWFSDPNYGGYIHEITNQFRLENFTIPVWDDPSNDLRKALEACGFELKSEQYGMSKALNPIEETSNNLSLKYVTDQESANVWSDTFMQAFGYLIHPETIMKTRNEVNYLLGMHDNEPVGTVVLFTNHTKIAGIHSMGIIPEMRKRGFAEDILLQTLNIAAEEGASHATLQASESGKHLYTKVGFQVEFTIKNYVKLKNNKQ
ncbi:MAG: GNAT family N-acetyltransferase [Fulvivirga sp.]|uniref:GNAT family N-acetyltransferase n=1 Tax=Fulvivirga sp. TaxID=1931237 RepID=UPI0032FF272B